MTREMTFSDADQSWKQVDFKYQFTLHSFSHSDFI